MPATIHDVARDAGVSIATVSRVIAGNYPVAAKTRERVLAAVQALDYAANPNARRLRGAAPGPIAVLLGSLTGPSFASLAQGVESESRRRGRVCLIGATGGEATRELEMVELMRRQQASAVIVPGGFWQDDQHRDRMAEHGAALARSGAKLILCGNRDFGYAVPDVVQIRYDNVEGAERIARHVVEMGHRHVVFLPGLPSSDTSRGRFEGFSRPFAEHAESRVIIRETSFDREPAKKAVLDLLDELTPDGGRPPFTAVICATDQMAAGVLEGLRARGLRCPEDVSVTGYDDIPSAQDLNPPLTTIRIPHEEMGALAVKLALGESDTHGALQTELLIRESVSAPGGPANARLP